MDPCQVCDNDPGQVSLFDDAEGVSTVEKEWQGMPEFRHKDMTPWKSTIVHFASAEDMKAFAKLIGQTVTPDTQSLWYPPAPIGRYANKRYADET